ncbi:pyrroline-5-carboxylate reductase 1-like protein [Dinothrombium tinctorium]|uniref:Pyrroline-5-carboxylate reductase n=1 Tax=Dinothrombium tinctorium TaxID=1965070 RepID=A0A3S3RPH4_9ACAR|nr:pyrroline-5-carboxylate reductase 1-like protein [Dinothrombium tinctorium]
MAYVGFIGAGRMAQALSRGFLAAGVTNAQRIIASAPREDMKSIAAMQSLGCRTTNNNIDVVDNSEIVILAVKPPVVSSILKEVSSSVTQEHLIISVALGIPLHIMEELLPQNSRVMRVMPNTPVFVRQGASVFATGSSVRQTDIEMVHRLFSTLGICERVPESALDAVTGLSGSGPAYCYLAIEALADGGVKQGLPRELALKLAAQTLLGAAKMVLETGKHPGTLKDDVCSPGGSTIEGVSHLERSGFRSSLIEAVEVATNICRMVSRKQVQQQPQHHQQRQLSALQMHISN